MLLGIGLLSGWAWKIHYDRQVVRDELRQVPVADAPQTPRWARLQARRTASGPIPRRGPSTASRCNWAGDIVLKSGLMEIAYDTGARVILQGPAAYEVESKSGGFLSVGRLTARAEKRAEGGGRRAEGEVGSRQSAVGSKSEIRNPKSLIPDPQSLTPNPLFSVRTPAAIVSDLGTEFGVEVDASGLSRAIVFQGTIEMRPADGSSDPRRAVQLSASQSAEMRLDSDRVAAMVGGPGWSAPWPAKCPIAHRALQDRLATCPMAKRFIGLPTWERSAAPRAGHTPSMRPDRWWAVRTIRPAPPTPFSTARGHEGPGHARRPP